jgi:hypothetical protein
MDKELKIIVSLILSMLVYGLASLSTIGAFVTPIFLHSLLVFVVAIVLALLNRSEKGSWILLVYILISLMGVFNDGYALIFLAEYFPESTLQSIYDSAFLGVGFLVLLYGFLIYTELKAFRAGGRSLFLVLNLTMILASFVLLFIYPSGVYGEILFMAYLLISMLLYNYFNSNKTKVLDVVFYQYLLLFALNVMEYFQ